MDVNTNKLPLPFNLKITVPGYGGIPVGHSSLIASTPSVIARLPAKTMNIVIEVLDEYGNVIPGATQTVQTGAPSDSSANPDPPYDVCNTHITLTNVVNIREPAAGFLNHNFSSSNAEALNYYNLIDPPDGSGNSTRDTLAKFIDSSPGQILGLVARRN